MRTLLAVAVAAILLLLPSAAQAYYVDISITGAGRVYETTDANELDEHCPDSIEGFASPSTTATGALGATCRAGDASGDYGWGWVIRYVAEPASGYRFDGWHSDGRTTPGPVLCDGSNGSSDYSGTACQFATHADLQVRARFVDDTAPAMSSLTGPNQVVNGPATFTFSAAADPTFRLFECRVAGVHDWQTCSSGRQENPSTGTYTFQVRAVDWSGNTSAESTWQWTVDKVAPETSLATSGPSGTVASTSAQFEFTSNESGTFTCTLDAVAVGCGSPKSYSALGQGTHTFTVQARDVAGNSDPSPASRTWTVDTVAPETTLAASGPTGTAASKSATFTFSSEAGASFRCQLDDQPVESSCASPRTYSGLDEGPHTFKVWARDGVANEDATPATRSWTVDTVAPATTLAASGPSGPTPATSATFTFSSEAGASFSCQLDDQAVQASCSSPRTYTGLGEGPHTFKVWARDGVGNEDATPATRSWSVDTVAPDTTLAPSGPSGSTGSASATFTFSSEAGASFSCQLDDQPVETPCASPRTYSGLADGPHTFKVWARDAAGNADATPATRSWTVADTAPPDTAIDSGPAQDSSTESTAATFAFSSDEAGTFECAVDGGAYAACTSPHALTGLSVGSHTFSVRARDAAGNADPSAATRTWVVTAPAGTGGGGGGGGGSTGGGGGSTGGGGGGGPTGGGSQLAPFSPSVVHSYAFAGARTRLTAVTIRKLAKDAKVQIRCAGGKRKGCKFKSKTIKHRGGNVKLAKVLRKLKLAKGAALELRITAASGQVKVVRYVFRRGKAPKASYRCAAAVGGKLGTCA
jgi:hypothetical protein